MPHESQPNTLFVTRLRRPRYAHAFERELEALDRPSSAGDPEFPEAPVTRFFSALESLAETTERQQPAKPASVASRYETQMQVDDVAAHGATTGPSKTAPRRQGRASVTLTPGLTATEIKRLRREYALHNHPDRVPDDQREEASRAMAQANAEFDKALKSARDR